LDRCGQRNAFLGDSCEVSKSVGDTRILQEVGKEPVINQCNGRDGVADRLFDLVGRLQMLAHCRERVVQRRQLVRPLRLLPRVLDLVEDVLLDKGFLGNRIAYDVSYAENGVSLGLRREDRHSCETKDCPFHVSIDGFYDWTRHS
jgi:hypothetical protein